MKHIGILLLICASLRAGIIVTPEAPGVQYTTHPGVVTETFDGAALGVFTPLASVVGLLTGDGVVVTADAFGGSNQSRYVAVGAQSGVEPQVLTVDLGFLQTFFGFFWGAVDPRNTVEIWANGVLVKTLTRLDVIALLTPTYWANPNTGENATEPYAYFNLTSLDGFDKVVFRNLATGNGGIDTGFELDSLSILDTSGQVECVDGCGTTESPEPGTGLVIGAGLVALGVWRRRR